MRSATVPTDHDIRESVLEELDWTPEITSSGIGVAVDEGVVTLSGEVAEYAERVAAKRAAWRVRGVSTVVDHLTVRAGDAATVTEADVAREVERALTWSANVPPTVRAEVSGHRVVLTGEVEWEFERTAARRAVERLRGVTEVDSRITLSARPSAEDTEERIRNALRRNALLDAGHIEVEVDGTAVQLSGRVQSWAEKEQAVRAAWSSPHVTRVEDRIVVRPA